MKHSIHILCSLGAAVLMGASPLARAQLWTTVYNSADDGLSGTSGDMGADACGNVFAAGRYQAADDSSVASVLACSANPGTAWELADAYYEEGRSFSYYRAFAADPGACGHLFAGGNLNNVTGYDPNGNPTYEFDALWIIRERDPVTGLWHTADDYSRLAADFGKPIEDLSSQASVSELRVANDGAVYAAGGGAYSGWIVRRRSANASTFVNVDTVPVSSAAWGMAVDPLRGVIVSGQVGNLWTVRRSPSGNPGSWMTIDSVVPVRRGEWGGGLAKGAAVSPSGTIYAAGTLYNNSTWKNHWVVRSSTDGGVTWSISDNIIPPGSDAEATGIVSDAVNNIYVCGRAQEADGYHWIVRKGTPTTKLVKQGKTWVSVTTTAWSTIDRLESNNSRANAITVDAYGNVFAGGSLTDQTGQQRLIVRKLPTN
jgi:hypothetical protein